MSRYEYAKAITLAMARGEVREAEKLLDRYARAFPAAARS